MMDFSIGLNYTSEIIVNHDNTAAKMESGDLPVFATPAMIALMENASMNAVAPCLDDSVTTVGGNINVSHLAPTKIGVCVHAMAELVQVEGRKLTFKVVATCEGKTIGEGTHVRYVVDRERFMK